MKINMGTYDRIIRILLAASLTLFAVKVTTGILQVVLYAVSGVFLLTSFISFCPLYSLFGLHTNKAKKD